MSNEQSMRFEQVINSLYNPIVNGEGVQVEDRNIKTEENKASY